MMTRFMTGAALAALLSVVAAPATAQSDDQSGPAVGAKLWVSGDSEGTEVVKMLGRALISFEDRERYAGIALEAARFSPATGEAETDARVYLDLADHWGEDWRWQARIGTDGQTVLGNAELRRVDWSQSLFVEREIIETEQGLNRRIYYTFIGASTDVPITDTTSASVTAGLQEFSGRNERLHLRGRLVHSVDADLGLSAQLDARYYHSTEPGEFDYFSPRNFVSVIPLVQLRRFDSDGWMFLAAGGVGAQNSGGGEWSVARYGNFRLESPRGRRDLNAFAEIIYSNNSITGGTDYDYVMGRAGVTFGF
ncbi:hypothetical protein [Aurantiacibacter sediminis]|uniref:DUF481 domain-containing protein n=1 Tax=Aurantiacibacter sediminis TaxID=2793064 RepID=A0ABS0N1H6_9SPHN|nr:hypothetical protein [Aurantiacibacter sediminis]MBH5321811.1 hypothetical protein [Aurantiacibacter sediminis]